MLAIKYRFEYGYVADVTGWVPLDNARSYDEALRQMINAVSRDAVEGGYLRGYVFDRMAHRGRPDAWEYDFHNHTVRLIATRPL